MTLNELQEKAHEMAIQKGFHNFGEPGRDLEKNITISKLLFHKLLMAVKIALIHSELSEMLEELRKTKTDWNLVDEEIADVFIRLGDLCGMTSTDVDVAVKAKMKKNEGRAYKHDKEF